MVAALDDRDPCIRDAFERGLEGLERPERVPRALDHEDGTVDGAERGNVRRPRAGRPPDGVAEDEQAGHPVEERPGLARREQEGGDATAVRLACGDERRIGRQGVSERTEGREVVGALRGIRPIRTTGPATGQRIAEVEAQDRPARVGQARGGPRDEGGLRRSPRPVRQDDATMHGSVAARPVEDGSKLAVTSPEEGQPLGHATGSAGIAAAASSANRRARRGAVGSSVWRKKT